MSEGRLDLLVEAYLDTSLTATDAVELAGALRTGHGGAVRKRLAFTGLLAQALDPADDDALARSVLARIDAEASSSGVVRAVQRSITTRKRHRAAARRVLPWALAAAALVALAAGWWLAHPPVPPATATVCTLVSGAVRLQRGGDELPAPAGTPVAADDRLSATGEALLRWSDGSEITLAAGSAVALVRPGPGPGLHLERGSLDAVIAAQAADAPFAIATPTARIEVVGTHFHLDAGPDRTRCDLHAGAVHLVRSADGRSLDLAAGQTALVAPGVELVAAPLSPPPTPPVEAAWSPLFPAGGLEGWQQQHGSWDNRDGIVRGSSPARGKARLLSGRDLGDLELTCRLRITGVPFAEIQVGDYNWFFEVPARDGAWITLSLCQRGDELTCTADGTALTAQAGAGHPARPGPLGFYVMPGGTLEITDAKIR